MVFKKIILRVKFFYLNKKQLFNLTDRHPEYNSFIDELNKVLHLFSTRGASSILLTDFTGIFKSEFKSTN